jgi:DNA polymerase-3 subunit beta
MLIDTVKEIKEPELIIEVGETQATIRIEKVKGKYSTPIQSVTDYPQTPDVEIEKSINSDSDQLQKAIGKVFFALGTDDLRPAMTGVLVEVGGNQTSVVATDAHVLSKYVINEKNDFKGSFIIPRKAASIIKEMKGTIQLAFSENNVKAIYENTTIICRLIDARYPDYRAVIPVDNPNEIILTTSELKGALKRVKLYANQKTNAAIFKIDETTEISSQDTDFNNEAVEHLTGELKGDAMTIGFNAKIVLSCLDIVSGESVEISYSSPTRAAIITEGELTMLLMPVALN